MIVVLSLKLMWTDLPSSLLILSTGRTTGWYSYYHTQMILLKSDFSLHFVNTKPILNNLIGGYVKPTRISLALVGILDTQNWLNVLHMTTYDNSLFLLILNCHQNWFVSLELWVIINSNSCLVFCEP